MQGIQDDVMMDPFHKNPSEIYLNLFQWGFRILVSNANVVAANKPRKWLMLSIKFWVWASFEPGLINPEIEQFLPISLFMQTIQSHHQNYPQHLPIYPQAVQNHNLWVLTAMKNENNESRFRKSDLNTKLFCCLNSHYRRMRCF